MAGRTFILVHSGDPRDRVGGARLRWDALAAGLEEAGRLFRFEPWCDGTCGSPHPRTAEVLRPSGWMPGWDPFFEFYCPEQAARLRELADRIKPAMVVGSGLEMARYLSELSGHPTVVDFKDVDSQIRQEIRHVAESEAAYQGYRTGVYADLFSARTVEQLEQLQEAAAAGCDMVWTCTDRDRALVLGLYGLAENRVRVVPNAVRMPVPSTPGQRSPERVVFIGKLNYFPCVQASRFIIERLAPALRPLAPELTITLVGAQPPAEIITAAARGGVEVVANPPDVSPYWAGSILVVPLMLGSGSRLKILEAFAHHVPVVTTAKGVEGILAGAGHHYLPAESAEDFAREVARVHHDAALRDDLIRAARAFVEANNSIRNVTCAVEKTAEALTKSALKTP